MKKILIAILSVFIFSCNKNEQNKTKDNLVLIPVNKEIILPVVFHILHNGEPVGVGDNVAAELVQRHLDSLNKYFSGNSTNSSTNTYIQFKLATKSVSGISLTEPGINRINVDVDNFDGEAMYADNKWKRDLIWDPNLFINVFIVDYTDMPKTKFVAFANYPFLSSYHPYPGITENNIKNWNDYAYRMGIYFQKSHFIKNNSYRTLSHEIGHYLGLRHVFDLTSCTKDGDYCFDTHDYNKSEYDNNPIGTYRNACDGTYFESTNLMDYSPGLRYNFTPEQIKRMRYVLSFAAFRANLLNGDALKKSSAEDLSQYKLIEPEMVFD